MRAINIKNIHHLLNYYVLLGILLLSAGICDGAEPKNLQQKLIDDAKNQQNTLIEKYGISSNSTWQNRCDELIDELQLNRFTTCFIIKAEFANAYSLAHGVVILTQGLLINMKNSDQLAHVLSHEHAHLTLKHHHQAQQLIINPPTFFTKSRIKKFYRKIEKEADQAADTTLLNHQRDPLQIHHYLMRIEKTSTEHSSDHQKLKNRIKRTDLPPELIDSFWLNTHD